MLGGGDQLHADFFVETPHMMHHIIRKRMEGRKDGRMEGRRQLSGGRPYQA